MKIDVLYKEYAEFVYKYIMSISGNHHVAEEITQETFYRALRSKGYSNDAKVTTWLCTIAKNCYISYLRKEKHRRHEDINELEIPTEQDMLSGVRVTEIYKAIHKLPEPYREVVLMKIHSDMSYSQIGDVFGKGESWARVTFFRGKEKLRVILSEGEVEET